MFDAGLTVQMGLVLEAVRERAPMVHLINPSVSQGFVADALLAAGAQPMITDTPEEAPALVDLAEALFINLGSLSHEQADTIPVAVQAAVAGGKPWCSTPSSSARRRSGRPWRAACSARTRPSCGPTAPTS